MIKQQTRQLSYFGVIAIMAVAMLGWYPTSDLATRVLGALQTYMQSYPPEKVYIMTDKPHYAVGENLWLKGWLVNGADHYPNSPSKILYVDLVSPEGEVVLNQTLRINEGVMNGDFYLPHELRSGQYTLRAYTKWMRNFNPDYFFHREIQIANGTLPAAQSMSPSSQLAVRFFPEGGEWVDGLPATLGVEARHADGSMVSELMLDIVNASGTNVAQIAIDSTGLGRVDLVADRNAGYRAVVRSSDDGRYAGQSFDLPAPVDTGFQLRIDASRESDISIQIQNNLDNSFEVQDILVLGHVRGIVFYAAVGKTDREIFTANIDRDRFPPGIIQFTVFTEAGTPVAERLVYNPDRYPLNVTFETDKTSYTLRDRIELSLRVTDMDGEPVDGNLALSVTDVSQVSWSPFAMDIRNYLQLASDLDAPLRDVGFYDGTEQSSLKYADLLMLTRGWRRFDWQQVLRNEGPSITYPIEQGLTISGSVTNKQNRRLVADQNVILALLGDVKEFYDMNTDESGHFEFNDLLFPDSTEVLVQTIDSRKRRHYDIALDSIATIDPRKRSVLVPYRMDLNEAYRDYLNLSRTREQIDRSFGLSNDVRMLGEVTVTAEREALPPPQRRSLLVEADRVIKAEDVGGYASNPLDMLRGRTAAFRVTGVGRDMTVTFNRGISWGGDPVPLFILDGMEVDLMTLVSIPASNVESIELLTDVSSLAVYGSRGGNGVIAVNTKPGGAVFAAREGIINRAFAGYYIPRVFYAPDYTEQLPIHQKPDSRSTIWWEPNVILNSSGSAAISFWTSDDTGPRFMKRSTRYMVKVEGMTSTGRPIVGSKYIEVR